MDNTHEHFMRRAIELARQGSSAGHGGPFGCVVVKDGVIVGEAFNQVVSSRDPTAHGEMVALRAAARTLDRFDLSGCEVYNISVPCPMCMAAMYWSRVSKVYYCCEPADAAEIGFDNATIDEEMRKPLDQRSLGFERLPSLYPEAKQAYLDWAGARGRTNY